MKKLIVGMLLSGLTTSCLGVAGLSTILSLTFIDQVGKPVPDVLVYSALKEDATQKPTRAVIDQKKKTFTPFVTSLVPGSTVSFPNSDNTRHHVYSFSPTKVFQLKLYESNTAAAVQFDELGIVSLGCNIHDNMEAYIVITDHKVFGISNKNGTLDIKAETNKESMILKIWHPQLKKTRLVTLPISESSSEGNNIKLDMQWQPPQQVKTTSDLESLLKQFKRNDN